MNDEKQPVGRNTLRGWHEVQQRMEQEHVRGSGGDCMECGFSHPCDGALAAVALKRALPYVEVRQ